MKTRQHFMLVAATVISSLAGFKAAAQNADTLVAVPKHPLIDSLEHVFDIKMQQEGFIFQETTLAPSLSLKIEFEDTDQSGNVSAKDQVIYAEMIDQLEMQLAWIDKYDETLYRALYKNNYILENQRYSYVEGVAMPRAEAQADSTLVIFEGVVSSGPPDAPEDIVFVPKDIVSATSPRPLLNKMIEKYKAAL